jgi:hypothetical protein
MSKTHAESGVDIALVCLWILSSILERRSYINERIDRLKLSDRNDPAATYECNEIREI